MDATDSEMSELSQMLLDQNWAKCPWIRIEPNDPDFGSRFFFILVYLRLVWFWRYSITEKVYCGRAHDAKDYPQQGGDFTLPWKYFISRQYYWNYYRSVPLIRFFHRFEIGSLEPIHIHMRSGCWAPRTFLGSGVVVGISIDFLNGVYQVYIWRIFKSPKWLQGSKCFNHFN